MNSSPPPQFPSRPDHTALDIKRMLILSHLKEGTGIAKGISSTMLTNLSMYDPNMNVTFATGMSWGEDEDLKSIVKKAAIDFAEGDELRRDLRYYFGGTGNPKIEEIRESAERLIDQEIMDRDLLGKDRDILKKTISFKVYAYSCVFFSLFSPSTFVCFHHVLFSSILFSPLFS